MIAETRRDREKMMHRQEILAAAKRLFARKGYHAATMDEIASEAEFSKGALYLYFDNKEDLFLSLIEEKSAELEERMKRIVEDPDPPEGKIRSLIGVHLNFFEEDRDFFQIMASERPRLGMEAESRLKKGMRERYFRYLDLIERTMREGISEKVLKEVDPYLLASALVGIVHAFTVQWMLTDRVESLSGMESLILELFLEGARS